MAASAAVSLQLSGWAASDARLAVVAIFAAGGLLAFAPATLVARWISRNGPAPRAFAANLLALSVATIGATATIYAFIYRTYYAQWHGETFGVEWSYELAFTVAAAVYQFAVMGLRHFVPLGLAALLAAAWLGARMPR